MRKTFATIALMSMAIVLGMPSCGSGEGGDGPDTATYTAQSDTLSELLGVVVGSQMAEQLNQYQVLVDSAYDKNGFVDGLEVTLGRRHPLAFVNGTTMALQISQDMDGIDNLGYEVDRIKVLDAVAKLINPEDTTAAPEDLQVIGDKYMSMVQRLSEKKDNKDNKETQALLDSIENVYAELVAKSVSMDIANYRRNEQKEYDSQQFMKGMRRVAGQRIAPEFAAGVYQASMLAQQMAVIEKKGVNVRPETVFAGLKEAIVGGKALSGDELTAKANALGGMMERINKAWEDAEDARLASTDEALQNMRTGKSLVAKAKEENPQLQTTESGLTYLIKKQGEGDNVAAGDTVVLAYTGSLLDGKVFDANQKAQMTLDRVIPGFSEGVRLLNKGAKARLWIPGELGYRGKGAPQAGIGPMETIVFDIEVIDIKRAK